MAATKIRSSAQLNIDATLDAQTHKIINVTDPTAAQDAATKNYVDGLINGLDWKQAVRAGTTANGTLATAYANGQVIDGVTLVTGDRILLKNQAAGAENGIYIVAASGAPSRSSDADTAAHLGLNATMFIEEGATLADTQWTITNNGTITVGTTALTFSQIGAGSTYTAADASITISGTTIKVAPGSNGQIEQTVAGVVSPVTVSGDASIASGGALTLNMSTILTNHLTTRETPAGTINGSNVTFTLASTPISGTEHVYLNGQLLTAGGADYSISTLTITMTTAPATGDILRVTYWK